MPNIFLLLSLQNNGILDPEHIKQNRFASKFLEGWTAGRTIPLGLAC